MLDTIHIFVPEFLLEESEQQFFPTLFGLCLPVILLFTDSLKAIEHSICIQQQV